jgi:phosphoribosylformimino-5-aminoimidazole carboxamide ribotide isomerase
MKVIPAIDIINGRCVRLVQGDYESVINYQEVEAAATEFFDKGVTSLHIVDLDAAKLGYPVNVASIQGVVGRGGVETQVGGGVRSLDSAKIYLDMGVSRVVVGTSVVHDKEFFALLNKEYPGRVVASLDYRRVGRKLMVATHGWQKSSEVELFAAIAAVVELGCRNVLATDISKDGTFRGPDTVTYGQILERFDVDLIASGGVGSISDLEELSMVEASNRQLYGAVVGRAIHDGRIDVQEALARWR